ncbi:unnamed protein product [Cylicocyclus nassatus]|uniref:E2F/DP family winged-helix DNA-binding domain-containing protein n=1 Tax=Cylicocyclus nassatus TaxID=53992 RepID=A0AA36HDB6_CYLNA|nr:unnamed protein product [Cylicocyclus nassatus]
MIGINQYAMFTPNRWTVGECRDVKCHPGDRRDQENSESLCRSPVSLLDEKIASSSSLSMEQQVRPSASQHLLHTIKARRKSTLKRRSSTTCFDVVMKRSVPGDVCTATKPYHGNTRVDNSLLVTTKKFMALKNVNDTVNLNNAAEELNVPKRRLYDITNVLEGINLVEKIGKNSIRWKTNDGDASVLDALKKDCRDLQAEEIELDAVLLDLTSAVKLLREDPTSSPYAYLRIRDLRSLDTLKEQTLVAVKSLPDTHCSIELADLSPTGRYQLKISTDNYSALRTYLCSSEAYIHSNVEDVLSASDHVGYSVLSSTTKYSKETQNSQNFTLGTTEEAKPSTCDEDALKNIVLPKTKFHNDFFLDSVTTNNVSLHAGTCISPLKMLLDSQTQFVSDSDSFPSQDRLDPDFYNFLSTGLSTTDLFTTSDWELHDK